MVTTLRLGYSVMVSATDSDSVGRGSNPCTPAFFISCRFFFFTARFFYLDSCLSFTFRSGFVVGAAPFRLRQGNKKTRPEAGYSDAESSNVRSRNHFRAICAK